MSPDDIRYLAAQGLGLLLALTIGFSSRFKEHRWPLIVVVGVVVNCAIEIPQGGGPGVLAGCIVVPLVLLFIGMIGRGVRGLAEWVGCIAADPDDPADEPWQRL